MEGIFREPPGADSGNYRSIQYIPVILLGTPPYTHTIHNSQQTTYKA